MVFESLVADLLNRFLGDFVDNLDSSQLNIGIWGGDVKLENLDIKETALDDLDLPVKLKFGFIKSLVLKIPWKNLYTEPVLATIDGVNLIVVPNKGVVYNAEKAEKNASEVKQKTLTRLEEARKKRRKPPDAEADSFAEKMVAQVIKNLQVAVHNVHVRFEDKYTNRDRPFAAGVTLSKLELQTTDKNWKPTIHKEMVKIVHKLVNLDSLAVYWNSETRLLSDLADSKTINAAMKEAIATGDKINDYKYIIEPIKMHAKLSLNQKPENDGTGWKTPKMDLNVDMTALTTAINALQYQDLLLFLEAQERFGLATQYLRYRPNLLQFRGHYKEWWHFAYNAVLMEKVRRRRDNWNWERMKKHRQLVRKYSAAWVKKQTDSSIPAADLDIIKEAEKKLDVFNVNVARQQAEMEIDRKGLKRLEDQPQGWVGWAKSWWGSGSAASANAPKPPAGKAGEFAKKFEEAMTPEEKAKLFEAIDYQENMPPTDYPKHFVQNRVDFKLGEVAVVVEDALHLQLKGLHAALQQRPAASAINLMARIAQVKMDGMGESMLRMREQGDWLSLEVDTKPLDAAYDQQVKLDIAPINLFYHAPAVNKCLEVFKPPESVKLNQLAAAAMSRYEEVKTRSVAGLAHAVEEKSRLVLDIAIQPATILICQDGIFNEDKPIVLADLGLLTISTIEAQPDQNVDKLDRLMEQAYDRFRVELNNFVVVLAENMKDAEEARRQKTSPLHLLRPTGLDIQLHKCAIDDLRLPKLRVLGKLPDIVVGVSDEHLLMLFKLLLSIPKPPAEAEPKKEKKKETVKIEQPGVRQRAKMKTILETNEVALAEEKEEENENDDVIARNLQQVQVQVQLTLSEVGVVVLRGVSPLLELRVLDMKCDLKMRTHDLDVKAQMGALVVSMPGHSSLVSGRQDLFLIDNEQKDVPLLSIHYVQANPESPFFTTTYQSTLQAVDLKFTGLSASLHQEALVEAKKFGEEIQAKLNEVSDAQKEIIGEEKESDDEEDSASVALSRSLSQVVARSMQSLSTMRAEMGRRKKSRKEVVVPDVIDMKVIAEFGTLAVYLGSSKGLDTAMAIEDVRATVKLTKVQMEVEATLKAISVVDSTANALYKNLMSVQGDDVMLRFSMIQYIRDEKTKRPLDLDMRIKLRLGRLHFVFVNLWVCRILLWLKPFQAQAAAAASAAGEAATAKASQAAADMKKVLEERPPRMLLDVHLDAPVIIVPRLSTSTDIIYVDLGSLIVKNAIESDRKSNEVVLDIMEVQMSEVNCAIGTMDEKCERIVSKKHILEPITFAVKLDRNLSWSASKMRAQAAVDVHLSSVVVKLSQTDYATIINTLNGNLAEKGEDEEAEEEEKIALQFHKQQQSAAVAVEKEKQTHPGDRVGDASASPPEVKTAEEKAASAVQLDVRFVLDELKAMLLAHDDTGITTLSLTQLTCNAQMKTDNAMDVRMSLIAFTMYDDRLSTKIRELMEKKREKAGASHDLINLHFAQNATQDKHVQLNMCAFFICLCPEFLGMLARFFTVEKTEEQVERELAEAEKKKKAATAGGGSTPLAVQAAPPAAPQGTLSLDCLIQGIEVIVVEDSTQPESSQALLLTFNVAVNSIPTEEVEVMKGGVEGLRIYSSYYAINRRNEVTYEILRDAFIRLEMRSEKKSKEMAVSVEASPLEVRMAPSVIRLLSAVNTQFAAANSERPSTSSQSAARVRRFKEYWKPKTLNESSFWFLSVPVAEEATEGFMEGVEDSGVVASPSQSASLTFPSISFTLESDENNVVIPLVLMGMRLQAKAWNWSSALRAEGQFSLQMSYFNEGVSVWEPLIEPCEGFNQFEPWCLRFNVTGRNKLDPADTRADLFVKVEAENALNVTVTTSLLDLSTRLSESFTRAAKQIAPPAGLALPGNEPLLLLNDTGYRIKIHNSRALIVESGNSGIDASNSDFIRLNLNEVAQKTTAVTNLFGTPAQQEHQIDMILEMNEEKKEVMIGRAGRQLLRVAGAGAREEWLVMAETRVEGGRRLLTLRSHIRVISHLEGHVEVLCGPNHQLGNCANLEKGEMINLPIEPLYSQGGAICIKPEAWEISDEVIHWRKLNGEFRQMLTCPSSSGGSPLFVEAVATEEICHFGDDTSKGYVIHLHPPLQFQNLLPTPLSFELPESVRIDGGESRVLNIVPGHPLRLTLTHLGEKYILDTKLSSSSSELKTVKLLAENPTATQSELLLGLSWSRVGGAERVALYAPFWVVNNTSHILKHMECSAGFLEASAGRCVPCKKSKAADEADFSLLHKADNNPIILPYPSENLATKKKARVAVGDSAWSDSFPLDTAGNAARITCKSENREYDLSVDIRVCSSALTKVVTFSPFYLVSNCGRIDMEVREHGCDEWLKVPASTCVGLYPRQPAKRKLLSARYVGSKEESLLFPITESIDTFAHINDDTCGVSVSTTVGESSCVVHLTPFSPGQAPAHVINHTKYDVVINQKGHKEVKVGAHQTVMFTWADLTKNRILEISVGEDKNEDTLDQSRYFTMTPNSKRKNRSIYVASFLNGRQRTLLFASDTDIAKKAYGSWETDQVKMQAEISLNGIGLSVVDNNIGREILFMGIFSSAILWEEEAKAGRFKPFSVKLMEALEAKYQAHLLTPDGSSQWADVEVFKVDFTNMVMQKKKKEVKIRRCFERGIWVLYGKSKERTNIHLKLNHLQIDNQLDACVFPCVLSVVPPPKSVVADNAPKPFVEVSLVKRESEHSSVVEIEYLKLLMQEFAVRVDQGLINALLLLVATENEAKAYDKEAFEADMKLTETKLEDLAQSWKVQRPKSFYQLLHISPLMIHLSFSQGGTSREVSSAPMPIQSQFVSVLLKSVGVTLTELQDVVFKLAYFERKCVFYSNDQLNGEVISHYTKQAIKQLYVLVLGLDIIGNPFGLVRDLSAGVEDLFYQPFQGAIAGPEEFVSGMALGVQSLVGHTIGGAAGAVGRITGTVGKGVAALTFDDDYQRKRQEELNRKPQSFGEGMARGVKGLTMGVIDGVTGVVTKPIEGARQGGAGGFVKGVGKGLVGVVTRPVSGVVDFASSTMNSVKRVAGTDRSNEPLRPPRIMKPDKIVRPFCLSESMGHKIFKDTDHGALADTDHFVTHASISDKCVLVATDKRLAICKRTDVMGTWTIDWEAEYGKMNEPTQVEGGLQIALKEKKKGFLGIGRSQGKIITFKKPEEVCAKIIAAFRTASPN